MRRALSVALATFVTLGAPETAHAQNDGLRIRATRRDTIRAGSTVTAAFAISNQRADTVQVMPHVEVPTDWAVLMGGASFAIQPRSTEMLMLSVVVPARAVAGVYPIRVRVTGQADPNGIMDSIVVLVPPRHALEVGLLDRPGFVVSGKTYDAGFLVRNRGNSPSVVRLSARSSLGAATLSDATVQLNAEESRVVRARVRTPSGLHAAMDDVLEIVATETDAGSGGGASPPTEASARVTIVPEPGRKIEEYLKVPTRVNLRAASSDGVSPFEIFGRGVVRDGGSTEVAFLFRGPTGPFAAFGERDEYRAELRAPSWRARLGDQLFILSPLTGGAQPGFGVGADGTRGAFSAGAYGQHFRRVPEKGTETGAFLSARPFEAARVALNVVDRAGGGLAGRVASGVASFYREAYGGDVEVARSDNASGSGMARALRLSGTASQFSYDAGHQHADTAFAGSQRGSEHTYVTASSHHLDLVSFAASGSRHRTDLSRSTGVPYIERLDLGTVSATLHDRYTLELGSVIRGTVISGVEQEGQERRLRARADHDLRFGLLSLESEVGQATNANQASTLYSEVSIGTRHSFERGAVAFWAERYSGGSITKGTDGSNTIGGDATLRVSRTTNISLQGYATRLRTADAGVHSQLDALVSHHLPNGTTVTLRARILGGGSISTADHSVAYLEYGVPLRLPVSRLRTPGRVFGRVVDASTGRGVPGALVRLGPQVAITDAQGQVAFGGVPGGEHRVSMSQETSFADAVFVGDPTLRVDSTQARPTTFKLAIARSARVDVVVRRFSSVRTGIAGAPDSLADAGSVVNASLVLAGERDTLYRTTGEDGKVSFTDVPPGTWVITIRGDAPAFHRFDPDRIELQLAPEESRALAFRLIPRRREVQLIGDGQELRPTTADPKSPPKPGATKTIKPNQRQD
ncbi:MAG: NEW3 domain-containing protein [Gemmatimonadaceae bacterium]